MVLYSDWSELQCEFSKTFRRKNKFETLSSVKQRNREFYWWSRNLREVVEYYGNKGWKHDYCDKYNKNNNYRKGPFYTGMNYAMVIPEILIRLNGPCSSSRQIEVAMVFAGNDGMVIEMDNQSYNQSYWLRCIDMNWISQYAGEDEYVFMGGCYRIRISSITIMSTANDYEIYFRAMYYFDAMITGTDLGGTLDNRSELDYEILVNLIQYETREKTTRDHPLYVHDTFRTYTNTKTQVVVNMRKIAILTFNRIGSLIITEFYSDGDKSYSINPLIYSLFHNLQSVVIITTGYDENDQYQFYRINISDLLLTKNKNVNITVKAEHEYNVESNENGIITNTSYVGESWLCNSYKSMATLFTSEQDIFCQTETIKDGKRNDLKVDILSIGCAQQ